MRVSAFRSRRPEASPIPTTKLKQPALHWAQVVSVTAGLSSDLHWPALAAFWNAFFLLTCRAGNASSFFHDFDEAMCSGASVLLDDRRYVLKISFTSNSLCTFCADRITCLWRTGGFVDNVILC